MYESPTTESHATSGPATAKPKATNNSLIFSVRFSRAGSEPMLPLIAAYTAKCAVATPIPTKHLHAMNISSTYAPFVNPSSPATPKSIPPAPCKNKPTIINAARPPSASVNELNAFVAPTVPIANAPNTNPVHTGLYPKWLTACGSSGSGAAMIKALVKETQCSKRTSDLADLFEERGKKSDAVSYASSSKSAPKSAPSPPRESPSPSSSGARCLATAKRSLNASS